MAVTKIWAIKDSLQRVIDYAANPDKTEYDALAQTLHYAENDAKTKLNESAQLVTGIHCRPDHAWEDMRAVQERFGKTDGVVALHAYQSFREGEVTPEQCHEIGVALARKVWGKRFQVLVATHMNTDNLHNHFVINSVSYVDGKKYEQRRSQYAEFRETSDKLCREYGLSVVEQPKAKEPARYARMREAIDQACEDNLAKSTRYSYWSGINIHLIPMLGEVSLNKLTPQMIDDMIAQLREKGLAENSVRYCHRILSSALSSAVKYGYIPNNPAKNIMTRFSKNAGRKYDKYTVEQVQQLLAFVHGNALETVVLLAVLFGLRLSEALGLRWRDVDLTHRQITLRGQIPCDLPKDAKIVPHLEPLKDRDEGETRSFPITEEALPIFLRLRQEQADQRRLCKLGGIKYYDNDLVVCKPDGSPYLQKRISVKFNGFMRSTGMPKIRFHDLRGTAGTNMYNLTGDFYAVSQILGHSVDDFSQQMGVNLKINTVTTRYVQVQEQRKLSVLTAYHQAVFATPKNAAVGDNSL